MVVNVVMVGKELNLKTGPGFFNTINFQIIG
jgi:hypothetical protein